MADRTVKVTLTAQAAGYIAGMEQAGRRTRETGSEIEKLAQKRQSFDMLGRAALGFGAATLAATGLAIKAAMDWESAWAGVLKTNDGTEAQIDALQDGIRGLARELPATHTEIAAVAEAAGQLGVAIDDVTEFTKVMIDLGETTNLSAQQAATELARFMNVMGTAAGDVDRLGASIVHLGNNYATTEAEIVEMAQRLSGAGAIVGLTEGEVLGLATSLSAVGIEAQAGGSAISKVLINISAQVATSGPKLALFAETAGMSAEAFSEAWKSRPAEALAAFVQGLAKAESQGGSTLQILADLGITEVRMRDALLRSSAAADDFAATMREGNEAWAENTALLDEAEKRYRTTESQLAVLGNRVNEAAINFGTVFLPAINQVAQVAGGFADLLASMPPQLQSVAAMASILAGGFALVGGAALLAIPKIVEFRAAMQTLNLTGVGLAKTFGKGGLVAVALMAGIQFISSMGRGAELTSQQLARLNAALDAGSMEALDAAFSDGTSNVDSFRLALEKATASSGPIAEWNRAWLNGTAGLLGGLIPALKDLQSGAYGAHEQFRELGTSMGSLARDSFPATVDQFKLMVDAAGGTEEAAQRVLDLLGDDFKAALIEVAAAEGIVVEEQELLNLAWGKGEHAAALMERSAKDSIPTLDQIAGSASGAREQVEGLSEEIRNFGSLTYDAIEAELKFNEAVLDAKAALGEDGFKRTLNQSTEAGIANWRTLLELGEATNEYAAAAYDARLDIYELNGILDKGRERLIKQAMQFGATREEAEAYATQLIALPEVIRQRIELDTNPAIRELRKLQNALSGNLTALNSLNNWRPAGFSYANAAGGLYNGGVKAFAAGGFSSGIYPHVEGGIHKFAEAGPEAYISLQPQYRERNQAITQKVAGLLGMNVSVGPQMTWLPAPPAFPMDGMRISGKLDLGNGLVGMIDGRIQSASADQVLDLQGGVA